MRILRNILIFWTLFIGIGALLGTAMMIIDPTGEKWGMEILLELMQVLPFPEIFFTNFIFPSIMLLLSSVFLNLLLFIYFLKRKNMLLYME